MSIYKPMRIIDRASEKVDYDTDLKVIAEFQGTRLVWTPGRRSWECRSTGYKYKVGFYSYQSESEGDYFVRLRNGFDHNLTPDNVAPEDFADPDDKPNLNKKWVAKMVGIIRANYNPDFPVFEYKRGCTFVG
jgi:hypothetical protein